MLFCYRLENLWDTCDLLRCALLPGFVSKKGMNALEFPKIGSFRLPIFGKAWYM